jgi:hypothetical protein
MFEWACRQYLWRAFAADSLPEGVAFVDIGTWWGARDREIDVVAVDEHGQTALAGSCKWTNDPMDVSDLNILQRDLLAAEQALRPSEEPGPWLALFSREGFTDRLRALAAQEPGRLLLVDLEAMYAT